MKSAILTSIFAIFLSANGLAQNADDKLLGIWLTADKDGKIEIFKKADRFYGKLIWVKEPNEPDGKLKLDAKNPDPKLRSYPIQGMVLLNDFVYDGDNVWNKGTIYDARSGKTYSCKMTLKDKGKTLNLRGFVGVSFLGQTTAWTRVL